ncbi:MAG: toxin, partial [Pseudanabaena sp.]
ISAVAVEGYVYLVPFVETEEGIFLKTIIPSRKATKKYLGETND